MFPVSITSIGMDLNDDYQIGGINGTSYMTMTTTPTKRHKVLALHGYTQVTPAAIPISNIPERLNIRQEGRRITQIPRKTRNRFNFHHRTP